MFYTRSPKTVVRTCVMTCNHESFEQESPKHRFTRLFLGTGHLNAQSWGRCECSLKANQIVFVSTVPERKKADLLEQTKCHEGEVELSVPHCEQNLQEDLLLDLDQTFHSFNALFVVYAFRYLLLHYQLSISELPFFPPTILDYKSIIYP